MSTKLMLGILFQIILVQWNILIAFAEPSEQVLMAINLDIGHRFWRCHKKMRLPDSVTVELLSFWDPKYTLKQRASGCALLCMSMELKFVQKPPLPPVNEKNVEGYLFSKGADDAFIESIRNIYNTCKSAVLKSLKKDVCDNMLQSVDCFRKETARLSFMPPAMRRHFPRHCRRSLRGNNNMVFNNTIGWVVVEK